MRTARCQDLAVTGFDLTPEEAARLTVDAGRGVLTAGGIGHVADHVIRL
jgi:hypothetical protein